MFAFFVVNRFQTQKGPNIYTNRDPKNNQNVENTSPENHCFLVTDFDVILDPKLCPNGAQNDPQIQPDGIPGPPCGVQDDVNMPKMTPKAILGSNTTSN